LCKNDCVNLKKEVLKVRNRKKRRRKGSSDEEEGVKVKEDTMR